MSIHQADLWGPTTDLQTPGEKEVRHVHMSDGTRFPVSHPHVPHWQSHAVSLSANGNSKDAFIQTEGV